MQTLAKIARKVLTPKFFDLRIHTIVHNMIDNDISCRSKSLTKLFFPLDGLPWILSARPHWVNNPHKSFSRSFKRLLLPMSFFLWNESFGQFCKTGTNSDLAYPISCIRICLCICILQNWDHLQLSISGLLNKISPLSRSAGGPNYIQLGNFWN